MQTRETLCILILLSLIKLWSVGAASASLLHSFPWTLHLDNHFPANDELLRNTCGIGKRTVLPATTIDVDGIAYPKDEYFLRMGLRCNYSQQWPAGRVLTLVAQEEDTATPITSTEQQPLSPEYEVDTIYLTMSISARIEISVLNAYYRYQLHALRARKGSAASTLSPLTICFHSELFGFFVFSLDHHRAIKNIHSDYPGNEFAFQDAETEPYFHRYRYRFTIAAHKSQFPLQDPDETSQLYFHESTFDQTLFDDGSLDPQTVLELQAELEALQKVFNVQISDISIHYTAKPTKKELQTSTWFQDANRHSNLRTTSFLVDNQLTDDAAHNCRLLGSTCAVTTKAMRIHDLSPLPTLPRILCAIYSTAANHDKVRTLYAAWAHKCTAFLVFSTADDDRLHAINFPHYGEEVYTNMWIKVRSMWKFLAMYYLQEFDWFLAGGDDMFYVMENLYHFLATDRFVQAAQEQQKPLYLGRPFRNPNNHTYNSGGPGYLLNRVALQTLFTQLQVPGACAPFTMDSGEDVFLGQCLKEVGIAPIPTRDEADKERFHIFPPGFLFTYTPDPLLTPRDWFFHYDQDIKTRAHCCSQHSISFHYISPPLMSMLADFLYRCPSAYIQAYYDAKGSADHFDRVAYAQLFAGSPSIIID